MKKLILGLAAAAAVAVAAPGLASADASNNGTTNDAMGWATANHLHNYNGDHHGAGWIRSEESGEVISERASNPPAEYESLQGTPGYPSWSNNG